MKKVFKYLFLFLIIFLIFGGIYLLFKNFKVQRISCKNQFGNCSENLELAINNLQSKHGNIIATRNDLNNLLKNDKAIENYSINFKLPNSFEVNVIDRTAIVAFLLRDGSYALVDDAGNVTQNMRTTNLPKITSVDLDRDQFVFAANLIWRVYTFYKPTGDVKITNDGIEIDHISGKTVLFPLSGDPDVILGSLSLIISRLPTVKEASTIGIIDLRFKNPVLR